MKIVDQMKIMRNSQLGKKTNYTEMGGSIR